MTELLSASDESAALEALHASGCTDGLPVIIPTPERVERMVLSSGQSSDMVLGTMGPGHGVATIEKIAVSAVMAGCLPDYMPVVIAAAKAVIDPLFDLTEMQATTHCTAPLIIVNGPVRQSCDIASGYGALGPGHRANASIGRALRLAMINIGKAQPGSSDMALLGHPGKFTYCLAEDEENSPFPPLHVSLGFDAEQSVVTVIGAEAPHSVLFPVDGNDPEAYKALLEMLAIAIANPATNNALLTGGNAVVVLNPEHAEIFVKAGLSREDIAAGIYAHSVMDKSELDRFAKVFTSSKETERYAFKGPEQILVMMAGGAGVYSMVMPTWCGGSHRNSPSSVLVEDDFFCELPG